MRHSKIHAAIVGLALLTTAGLVHAGDRDHVYADSFGNLVVIAEAGYKRIVVGQGAQAGQVSEFTGSSAGDVVYADEKEAGCYRAPYLIKGRSYMYGFDQGEIPFQGGPCR